MIAAVQALAGVAVAGAFIGLVCTIAGCIQSLRGNVGQIEES